MLKNKTIIVGVSGGIAAYKTCEVVSRLKDLGANVYVVMTKSAQEFVSPLTFRTLSGNPVITYLFSKELKNIPVPHISLSQKADLIIIAPATANIIGKVARGIADDPISTITMSAKCKKLIAPAMNCEMWRNPVVSENTVKLKKLGFVFVGPEVGKLACGDHDIGRMSEPNQIIEKAIELIGVKQDLKREKILVTAGGTREAIDPVRFISNRSSGKMGYAVAEAARDRGAEVTLISANVALPSPLDIKPIKVESADEMLTAVLGNYSEADIIIMAAAVGDYKSEIRNSKFILRSSAATENGSETKLKSKTLNLKLIKNHDIIKTISQQKGRAKKILVGFALETDNLLTNAKKKLKEKDLDMIVANDETTFDSDSAKVTIISKNGKAKKLPKLRKSETANRILDALLRL
ncbi:bifunctional phosphopantothenoylcysteine decarboxylase/phosphopantothenate--cysteine ligase CoaBC [Candidatus Saganbacteria bacterium]|nr:bifunctional phosphopantothenoylcysteine decarboxylase/phosphopantothenate--cysteine ligase CoaBC [Candidatus Saganbacteria bacterium]